MEDKKQEVEEQEKAVRDAQRKRADTKRAKEQQDEGQQNRSKSAPSFDQGRQNAPSIAQPQNGPPPGKSIVHRP